MIKIAFCDDEKHYLKGISKLIKQELQSMELEYDIEIFEDGNLFLKNYKKSKESFELIFLDIDMQGVDGITLAKRIRELDEQVVIVFLTMMESRVYDTFGYNAFRFIVKGQGDEMIRKIFRECIKHAISLKTNYLLNVPKGVIRVRENEIIYFERRLRKFYIKTNKDEYRIIADKFEEILDIVGDYGLFQRLNRSILINLRYVSEITKNNEVIVKYGNKKEVLTLSRGRRKKFYDSFITYIK